MQSWDEITRDNPKAAQILADRGQFRSCASRAYFAASSAVSFALRAQAPFDGNHEPPAHRMVTTLIDRHLAARVSALRLREIKSMFRRLYNERINADYRSGLTIDKRAALQSRRDAHCVCRVLGLDL